MRVGNASAGSRSRGRVFIADCPVSHCRLSVRLGPIPALCPLWTLCDASESSLSPSAAESYSRGQEEQAAGPAGAGSRGQSAANATPVRRGRATSRNECCASVRTSEPLCAKTRFQANAPNLERAEVVGALVCGADDLGSRRCRLTQTSPESGTGRAAVSAREEVLAASCLGPAPATAGDRLQWQRPGRGPAQASA